MTPATDTRPTRRLRLAHASMQFSDTDRQHDHDARVCFTRGYDWITGTEAGGKKSADLRVALHRHARANGYRLFIPRRPTDCWIGVSRDLIAGGWSQHYEPVIPGSSASGDPRKYGPKGVVSVGFDTEDLGHIGIAAAHYLTRGRRPGPASQSGPVDRYAENTRLARAIGEWAREAGKGSNLAFYGGDQNIVDRTDDTFRGEPLTSAWDHLGKYENTGHGVIDVIASYDGDGRVTWRSIRALDDRELFLHADHFLVEAVAEVRVLR